MKETKKSLPFSSLLFFISVVLTVVRVVTFKSPLPPEGSKIRIRERVLSEPKVRGINQEFRLSSVFVRLPLYPQVYYGDFVTVDGELHEGKLTKATLVGIVESTNHFFVVRRAILENFERKLPSGASSLMAGMVLGSKRYISNELYNTLRITGTTHVIVASGMNISLIGSFAFSLLSGIFARRWAASASIAICWIYTFFAGAEAPLVRASFMVTVSYVALIMGKKYQAVRALLFAVVVMLMLSPQWITDIGFQLSVVSTLALMLFEKRVGAIFSFLPKFFKEGITTSIAAQIGVSPLLFWYFGSISLLSPLVNALVLWTVPMITIGGMIAGILGLLVPLLGELLLWLLYPLLWWFLTIVELFGNLL